jgi:hypothetical protein
MSNSYSHSYYSKAYYKLAGGGGGGGVCYLAAYPSSVATVSSPDFPLNTKLKRICIVAGFLNQEDQSWDLIFNNVFYNFIDYKTLDK